MGVLLLLLVSLGPLYAAPVLITYGREALSKEGDNDYTQVIYLSVPEGSGQRLYLRVFDPETTAANDQITGIPDTKTMFTLFGGAQVYTAPTARAPLPSPTDLTAGQLILQQDFGDETVPGLWRTLGSFLPAEGELVAQRRVFKLVVDGREGNDGNRYDVAVSLRPQDNTPPDGLRMFTYSPTLRVRSHAVVVEMRFGIPQQAETLEIHNFDAAYGLVTLETPFRTVLIAASGSDEWGAGKVPILEHERGTAAAVYFSGGREMQNDATFYVTDQAGNTLPIDLPILEGEAAERPVATATFTPLSDCVSVAFDASGSQTPAHHTLRYRWDFGDGTQGEGMAPVHVYAKPGAYQVTLTVIDTDKTAINQARKTMRVVLPSLPVASAGPDRTVIPQLRVLFDGSASTPGDGKIVEYTWGFSDGSVVNGRRVSRVFNQPGKYLVTLRVTNNTKRYCNRSSDQIIVNVNAAPVAEAGPYVIASVGETIQFDGSLSYDTDGKLQSYVWSLGDGTPPKTGMSIEHTYPKPGRYPVSLTVTDDAGVANSVATDTLTAVITYPPFAEVESDRSVAIGEVTTFDGRNSKAAMGELADYFWDFGDGAKGRGINVVYAYKHFGRYRVILTVHDKSSLSTVTSSDALVVFVNQPPVAKAGEDIWTTQSEVHFDGTGSTDVDGRIASYHWTFGDGLTSSEPKPVHRYVKSGTYNVLLTVTDDSGTIRNTSTDTLKLTLNAAPIADAGADQVGEPEQQLFFDAGASVDPDGRGIDFSWNFGDGNTGSGKRVSHKYAKPGVYTVMLRAKEDTGETALSGYDDARVAINFAPISEAGHDILAAPEMEVVLSGAQSVDLDGEIVSYRWTFSDLETISNQIEVRRSYASPGLYTASLLVTDDSGAPNNTALDEVTILINNPPIAKPGNDVKTNRHSIPFDASQSSDPDGHALTYTWDLGGGTPPKSGVKIVHTYANGGKYPVKLTVDDGTGLPNSQHAASVTVTVDRPPTAVAGADQAVCAKDHVVFDGSQSSDPDEGGPLQYRWTFGDGATADGINSTHQYMEKGVYPVTLTVQDASGFPENRHTDGLTVKVDEAPIAIAGPDQSACVHTPVFFDGSASRDLDGEVNRFVWDFGDTSRPREGSRVRHLFEKPGMYKVLLSITGEAVGECGASDTDELIVTVTDGPQADFTAPEITSVDVPVHFDASASTSPRAPIVSWNWDFGDGTAGQGEKVTHTYQKPGPYAVRLAITTGDKLWGCKTAAKQKIVTVNTAPQVVATTPNRIVGINQEVLLDASDSRDGDSGIAAYTWDLGDGATASGMQVRHRYAKSGTFPVRLTVKDNTALDGSSATAALEITVNSPPEPRIVAPERACAGSEVTFRGDESSDADGEVTRYEWEFGDGQTGEGAIVLHAYERSGRYQVTLTVTDDRSVNNSQSSITQTVIVNQPPRVKTGPPRWVCPNDAVTFDGTASDDVDGQIIRYQWDFGDGKTAEGVTATNAFAKPGRYPVTLSVTDDSGTQCDQAKDEVMIMVNATPSASAGDDRTVQIGGAYDVVLFDATQSTDPDQDPLTYEWTLGDDTIKTGVKVLHTYARAGQYRVGLRVHDGSNLACGKARDEVIVEVRNRK
jgi:PKD repeat protein